MNAIHLLDAPQRLIDLWEWIIAIESWIYQDGELLAELVKAEEIPNEFRGFISRIVAGEEKQKRKGKIPARERMRIAQAIDYNFYIIDTFYHAKVSEAQAGETGLSLCAYVADSKGVEPSEMVIYLQNMHQKILKDSAKQLGVSEDTIKNLLRDMRSYIKNWPLV